MSENAQFATKVIALTGAASGIGLATAHVLAGRGAKLSLADVQEEALQKAKAEIEQKHPGAEVITSALDVRKYEQVDSWIGATVERFGRLDGAANLAGVIPQSIGLQGLKDQDFAEWDFVMGVNSTGVMHCLRAQLAVLADNGAVVNASSIAGTTGRANNASYAASKHAVLGMTRSAAKEVGVRGIRVNAICPGTIATPMLKSARDINGGKEGNESHPELNQVALRRVGQPEEVAKLIAFLLSDESTYISGNDISIDGGWRC
ncbi:hypothetical protein PFICI_02621 [Pestalotiopsis fici W106-1]|uniref:Ketoreductase domain-containing protein n=1 Tax=Pestalotiopsis fici (strain W106-1 / CGMCC3.15140) TaxID=1229662 RepID=W3XH91_PESFW|nr:uncharacterized protein PFICI_02621 [Pestalotiopsis fici W106-1]ETS84596.1 hypothetical protein PFICI_02621 [Pestalotiopsis fici W106-1]